MADSTLLYYLVYSCKNISANALQDRFSELKIQLHSLTSMHPVKAYDISLVAPNNIDKLRRYLSRPRTLADGTEVHFAEVSRPHIDVIYEGLDAEKWAADGYSLHVLGQLVIDDSESYMFKAFYAKDLGSARAFADAGACIDPKYEATHANELRLWTAVLHGDLDELRRRIDAGDSVDQAHQGGKAKNWSPLSLCANLGRHEMAEVLLDHGANVNGIHGEAMKPIVVAASADDVAMMRLLVDRGATVDVKSDLRYALVPYSVRVLSFKALDYLRDECHLVLTYEQVRTIGYKCRIEKIAKIVILWSNAQAEKVSSQHTKSTWYVK